ncbi:ClpXP protease specificity-enhancing factor / Stringent starvation protein B [Klebsiella michiganensis]|uniref:ClpXP protease specificity-enhancing factor / Stringent starvation protein B n=1 Tax=Klebsiella michiganensis TaxID=1134687 RepID=A0A7H4M596_9ENTR|nr:ClpXP protease specificity-enhancing factor / Stringent starvation protein B [Klebsiella michiganensis]
MVPMEYARDGQIVLNIAPRAVGNLELATTKCVLTRALRRAAQCLRADGGRAGGLRARNGAGTMFEPEAAYDEDVTSLNDDEELPDSETVMSVIDGDKPDNHDDDPTIRRLLAAAVRRCASLNNVYQALRGLFYFLPFTVIAVKHPSLILYFILSDAGDVALISTPLINFIFLLHYV